MRLAFDAFVLDTDSCQLSAAGRELKLERRALDMLCYLALHPGRLISRKELLAEVWRVHNLSDGVLASTASKLRKALGQSTVANTPIETVRGRGYRFRAELVVLSDPPAPGVAPRSADRDSLVGRTEVLAACERGLERTELCEGQLLLVSGEAGIGKTSLLRALGARARERGFSVWEGAGVDDEGAPAYWPWVEILRAAHAQLSAPNFERYLPAGQQALSLLVPELLGGAQLAPGADAPATQFRVFDEVARWLAAASAHTPLLLVLDDLHWADTSSRELVVHAARALRNQRVLLACAARPAARGADDRGARALRRVARLAQRIPLQGLAEPEVGELLRRLHGDWQPSVECVRALSERTGGNPLFVAQISELLAQRKLKPDVESLASVGLPPALQDAIRERLCELPLAARELLGAAAAIGHDFDAERLGRLLELSLHDVLAALEHAHARGLLAVDRSAPQRFSFCHPLVRDALYEELALTRRGALHAKLLHTFALPEDRDARRLGELARHALHAVPFDLASCLAHVARAAEAARQAGGFEAAAELLSRALAKLAGAGQERLAAELLWQLGMDRFCAADAQAAFVALDQAAQLARTGGDLALLVRIACDLADLSQLRAGSTGEVRALLDEVLGLLGCDALELRAILLARRASLAFELTMAERVALVDEASASLRGQPGPALQIELTIARVRLRRAVVDSTDRAAVNLAHTLLKHHPRAVPAPHRAHWRFDVQFSRYYDALAAGALESADELAQRCAETARSSHVLVHRLVSEVLPLGRALGDARFEHVERGLATLRDTARQLSEASDEGGALGALLCSYYELRLAEARGSLPADVGEQLPSVVLARLKAPARITAYIWLAWLAARAGNHERARALLRELPADALARMPDAYGELGLLCFLAETYHALDERERAHELHARLIDHAALNAVGPCVDYLGSVSHYLGLLAALRGDLPEANQRLLHAEEVNRRLGMPVQLARSQAARLALT
jgi:DNA-binding winged helix-turn-helix (wHTH) protein